MRLNTTFTHTNDATLLLLLQIIIQPRVHPSYPFKLKIWSAVTSGCEVQTQNSQYVSMALMLGKTATLFPVYFKARWVLPHDLSAKGKVSQKNVWFAQERASSRWQRREWS